MGEIQEAVFEVGRGFLKPLLHLLISELVGLKHLHQCLPSKLVRIGAWEVSCLLHHLVQQYPAHPTIAIVIHAF